MSVVPEAPAQYSGLRGPASSEAAGAARTSELRDHVSAIGRYLRRNPSFVIGFVLLLGLLLFAAIGALTWDLNRIRPLSVRALQSPSWALPFGSDRQGRDLFASIIAGTPLTL